MGNPQAATIEEVKKEVELFKEVIDDMPAGTQYQMIIGFRSDTFSELNAEQAKTIFNKYSQMLSLLGEGALVAPVVNLVPHNKAAEELNNKLRAKIELRQKLAGNDNVSKEIIQEVKQDTQIQKQTGEIKS